MRRIGGQSHIHTNASLSVWLWLKTFLQSAFTQSLFWFPKQSTTTTTTTVTATTTTLNLRS